MSCLGAITVLESMINGKNRKKLPVEFIFINIAGLRCSPAVRPIFQNKMKFNRTKKYVQKCNFVSLFLAMTYT